ncbi:hypothetical protein HDU96_003778 [Phlyctochytrium bullatum]|nr:hypothetical protein HDU96_003778 [Phlyctochytrium bullatum]
MRWRSLLPPAATAVADAVTASVPRTRAAVLLRSLRSPPLVPLAQRSSSMAHRFSLGSGRKTGEDGQQLLKGDVMLMEAEAALFQRFVKTPIEQRLVDIGNNRRINTILLRAPTTTTSSTAPRRPPLVLTHGYGTGIGFWIHNLDLLSHHLNHDPTLPPLDILAIDWLGMGRSSRTPFPIRRRRAQPPGSPPIEEIAEAYFVDSLEAWREAMGFETMSLLGHSLGGFLSSAYAVKHPHRVDRLILASPFGLDSPPPDATFPHPDAANPHLHRLKPAAVPSTPATLGQRLFALSWHSNLTPQRLLRALGPRIGHRLTHRVVAGRFPYLPADDVQLLGRYLHAISASAPPAGEFALNALMRLAVVRGHGSIYAWRPVAERLEGVVGEGVKKPVGVLFGDQDWMLRKAHFGLGIVTGGKARMRIVRGAGHHLYMDNPVGFLEAVKEALE